MLIGEMENPVVMASRAHCVDRRQSCRYGIDAPVENPWPVKVARLHARRSAMDEVVVWES
jgi:hypothetical protein